MHRPHRDRRVDADGHRRLLGRRRAGQPEGRHTEDGALRREVESPETSDGSPRGGSIRGASAIASDASRSRRRRTAFRARLRASTARGAAHAASAFRRRDRCLSHRRLDGPRHDRRAEHVDGCSAGDRRARACDGRRPVGHAHVPEHVEVHGVGSGHEGRAHRLGPGRVHAETLSGGQGPVHEGGARRDGAPQRHLRRLRRSGERAEVEGRGAGARDCRHQLRPRHAARRARAGRRAPRPVHEGRLQGDGRDRAAVSGPVAERHERRPVLRARRGARHPGRHPHGHRWLGPREHHHAEVPRVAGRPAAARGSARAPSEAARAGDARRLPDDRQHARAAAGQLPRLRGPGGPDLELSDQGSEPLHRTAGGRGVFRIA